MTLEEFFEEHPKIALAFSGGVDSSYLLYAASRCGADVAAYYVKSQFQPEFELRDAIELTRKLGVRMRLIEQDIVSCAEVTANPPDRCYYCKKQITAGKLNAVEQSEDYLFSLGFTDFRVRVRGNGALLQFTAEQTERAHERFPEIEKKLAEYFDSVTIDPKVREKSL